MGDDREIINTLFILRGLPGAGKTSTAESLAREGKSAIHAADDYFYENGPNPGEYEYDPRKIGAAHAQCKRRVEEEMIKGLEQIFVTNTFVTEKEIAPYTKMAKIFGYRVVSGIIENRQDTTSVHNVPEEVVEKMRNRFTVKL